jgi:uncharacterized protein (DUF2147 family)
MVTYFNMVSMFRLLVVTSSLLLCASISWAQSTIEHTWLTEEQNAKVQIYKAKDGKYYGKIVWLKEPLKNGVPKLDENNPDNAKRKEPILGLLMLKGFEKKDDAKYENGTIYDPKNGKTYSCKITAKDNKLDVRGYVGFSMLGRTTVWTIAD